jgi:anti-sigma regulatory factor (Ser/Thr protein kinase)
MMQTARALQIPAVSAPLFEVALTEAVTNAVKHGHGGKDDAVIVCEVERLPQQVVFRISDSGHGFVVPDAAASSAGAESVLALPESGYGLRIIQTVFPAVRVNRGNGLFTLELGLPVA